MSEDQLRDLVIELGTNGLNVFRNQYGELFLYCAGDVNPIDSWARAIEVIREHKRGAA